MTAGADLAPALRAARHVVVLTGAGVSAESGLPTFRDPLTGLWARYRPEELATPEAFLRDPDLVWDWYRSRRDAARAARPNPANLAIARLETLVPRLTLITQNVDGLHRRAGSTDGRGAGSGARPGAGSSRGQVSDRQGRGAAAPPGRGCLALKPAPAPGR
jgi:NAD-dependent SIR2 family protein deacetylase